MHESSLRRRIALYLLAILGIWLALAIVLTAQSAFVVDWALRAEKDVEGLTRSAPLGEVFLTVLSFCLVWALLTPGVFWLSERFSFGQGRLLRTAALHIAGCIVCAVIAALVALLAALVIRHDIPKPTITHNVLIFYLLAQLQQNFFFYWAVLAVCHVINYYRQLRQRELRSSQLEGKLAQAQLQMLKMQLHPHFLFNTLNAISALIHQDVELADRMIARLGDLLRSTLENANQQEVSLRQELDFIQPYLEIEKARLGTRLTVELKVDPNTMDARVPNLILQPLVENAIRHGIAPRSEPGRIAISAARANGSLRLSIVDDGPGLKTSAAPAAGIGLANTRARLEKLYGTSQRLELKNGADRGLAVEITIPFQECSHVEVHHQAAGPSA